MGKGRPNNKIKHNAEAGSSSSSSRLWAKLPTSLRKHAIWVLAAVVLAVALLISQSFERWSGSHGAKGQSKVKSRSSRKPPPYKGSLGYLNQRINSRREAISSSLLYSKSQLNITFPSFHFTPGTSFATFTPQHLRHLVSKRSLLRSTPMRMPLRSRRQSLRLLLLLSLAPRLLTTPMRTLGRKRLLRRAVMMHSTSMLPPFWRQQKSKDFRTKNSTIRSQRPPNWDHSCVIYLQSPASKSYSCFLSSN